jgi:hypothetical protein
MKVPTYDDWGSVDREDLDASQAFDTFGNKSFAEARALFAENALFFQECLSSMPKNPFRFYVRALVDYLESSDSAGDSDGASSFLNLVGDTLKRQRELLDEETEKLLLAASRQITGRQAFYDADESIYGRFSTQLEEIEVAKRAPNTSLERTRD